MRLFKREEILGEGGKVYLIRWTLFKLFDRCLYLHHFIGKGGELHDHACDFVSVIFRGSYIERRRLKSSTKERNHYMIEHFKSFQIRRFEADHAHSIEAVSCWTLAFGGRTKRVRGSWNERGEWECDPIYF